MALGRKYHHLRLCAALPAAVRAQVSINKMESVMDDQAEIFQIRQKLDRLTFLTNFLA